MSESALMTIKGFPTSLPEAEIRGLLETIGPVDAFECEIDGASLTCRCRYAKEEDTVKAKKGFHDLEMGEMTLQVEVEEPLRERRRSSRRDRPEEGCGEENKPEDKLKEKEVAPAATTAADPPKRKKSRFAPPPSGAETLAAGLASVSTTPTATGIMGVQGLGAGGMPGMSMVGTMPAVGMVGGVGAMGTMGALSGGLGVGAVAGSGVGAVATPSSTNPMTNPMLKTQIELFVGNIPMGTTQQGLVDFLNAAMLKVGLNLAPGNPVVSCRLNPKFAFCVLRTPEEAAKALNLNGIPYLGNMLKLQRPSSYHGPPDQSVTWQVLTGQQEVPGVTADGSGPPYADRLNCEIFVGNIPSETPGPTLQEYLGGAMVQVGLAKSPNPILSIRMNARFAFLEMRSAADADAALNLDGIPFGGAALSVGRPKKYEGPNTPHKTWFDVLAECSFGLMGSGANGQEEAPTSTVVRLGNVVTPEELTDDDAQKEVVDDMTDECAKYGPVAGIEIPHIGGPGEGVGYVFIKYTSMESAAKAKKGFGSRTFDGKAVDAVYYPEERFAAKDFKS